MASKMARCSRWTAVHEVGPPGLVAARDAHAFAQVLLEEAEQQPELRIAGRLADHAVEGQVFGDAVAALGRRGCRWPARARRSAAIWLRVARSAASAAISPSSTRRTSTTWTTACTEVEHAGSKASALVERRRRDEHAGALARLHQRPRLELVHRLAHHGARDAVCGGQLLLGRQPVAGRSAPHSICAASSAASRSDSRSTTSGWGWRERLPHGGGAERAGYQVIIQILRGLSYGLP